MLRLDVDIIPEPTPEERRAIVAALADEPDAAEPGTVQAPLGEDDDS